MELRMESMLGPRVVFSGREYDYFAGTGYLGLQNHPQVQLAAFQALSRYGMSTGTSRGGYGEHPLFDRLEQEVCQYFEAESALYFATGYLSSAILVQGLREQYDRIFIDQWSHFSVWDGARSLAQEPVPFKHADPQDLAACLERCLRPGERPLILSDGVFPISGEIAPVPEYLELAEAYNGLICLDDAHAVGAIGPNGRGTLDHFGITSPRCYAAYTLSKALGSYGGLIAGSKNLIETLNRLSRVYVAASPTPLPVAAAAAEALHIARTQPELRQHLWQNVARARQGLRTLGWDLPDTPVPILCLRIRPELDLAYLKNSLFEQGICIAHVQSYSSTPPGGALRIAVFANHTFEQIDHLLASLKNLL
jgi:glycine C-acetyltransferase/8-amino-7-oxononanoate synthase